jgi:glyceraldehyde 3-phosphate dehydrogenase
MSARVGINGFGHMGRLTLRAAREWAEAEVARVDDAATIWPARKGA